MSENKLEDPLKGRGAQINTNNPFSKNHISTDSVDGIDEEFFEGKIRTKYYYETPKKVVNKIDSEDLKMAYSINPYQGCEHGCIYCYARNSHQYWGFSAGIDFESKIIIKQNAPDLLEEFLRKKNYKPEVISVSGNTDCYQPVERKLGITRRMLEVFLKFRNPVGMITKNSLITRDIDLLKQLAEHNLVHVMVSITSLKEELRLAMEPRTATAVQRLKVLEHLSSNGIPCGVMTAPIVPGLNSMEIPELIKAAANAGATTAGYTIVRLNGSIGEIFTDWVRKTFPDKAGKVLNQIKEVHGGSLNDSRWGTRMKGEGNVASSISQLFKQSVKRFMPNQKEFEFNYREFRVPAKEGDQLELF